MTLNEFAKGISFHLSEVETVRLYINMSFVKSFTINNFIHKTFPDDIKMDKGLFMVVAQKTMTLYCVKC